MDFSDLRPQQDQYAGLVVERILKAAVLCRATDVHLTQEAEGVNLRWRIDGRLIDAGTIADGTSTSILGRVKALANLITYRCDIPQEGRIVLTESRSTDDSATGSSRRREIRVGTIPTLHGERVVLRFAVASDTPFLPEDLGMPATVLSKFQSALERASGVILLSGPAGSGKTTTAYSGLRRILNGPQLRSVITLEDPVECEIEGAAQSQVQETGDYDWQSGLKALLRQDPEVMLVGEIRDATTASVVFQAAMTGQLVLTTMHAGNAVNALRRLMDLQVPAQHLAAGLRLLTCQRLLPKRCSCTRRDAPGRQENEICSQCHGSGTSGRVLLAEALPGLEDELSSAVVQNAGASDLSRLAEEHGMHSLDKQAAALVEKEIVHQWDVDNAI